MSPHPNDGQPNVVQDPAPTATGTPELPPPPNPSSDPTLAVLENDSPQAEPQLNNDIFKMSPRAALKLLSSGVEALVKVTGDIPPTPPPTSPTLHHMRGIQLEKDSIKRSNSEKELARMRQQAEDAAKRPSSSREPSSLSQLSPQSSASNGASQPIDGVRLRATPSPGLEPTMSPMSPEPYVIIGENSQPLNLQHGAITRKFYSKKPPPISVEDYLSRLHRFCPMSTAVYLATSLYIHRLAVDERAIPVTRRNAHRLLLAGLRVAMKALEDLSYPHGKMAKVGGVSELELARLEISFCFLTNFELVVTEKVLREHCDVLRQGSSWNVLGAGVPTLTLSNKRLTRMTALGSKQKEGG